MAQGMTRLVTDLAEQFRHLSVSGLELAEIGEQHWRQEEIAGAQPLTNNGNSFRADQLLRADARTPQNEALGKFDDLTMSPQMGMFIFGAWLALGGADSAMWLVRSRSFLVLGIGYLSFALIITMASRFQELRDLIPISVYAYFTPNDKTNLAPYRLVHFVVLAAFVVRLVPRDWVGLEWSIFRPAIKCGQQSLEVFCSGIFLSFAAHFVLVELSGALWMQLLVSFAGIAAVTALAYYRSWSKKLDKTHKKINATSGPSCSPKGA